MGTFNHNAVIAVTGCEKIADAMRAWIAKLSERERSIFSEQEGLAIDTYTFFLGPDGFKEEWPKSDDGDELRNRFIEQLEKLGSFEWVEVSFGEGSFGKFGHRVVRGSNGSKASIFEGDAEDENTPCVNGTCVDSNAPKCISCGTTENLEYGPDPYEEEIHEDDTPVGECADCRRESSRDI